jgi:hypothetical protein
MRAINEQRTVSAELPLLHTVDSLSKNRIEAPKGTNIAFRTAFFGWWASLQYNHWLNDDEDYGKPI